jgi:diaminopimelate epimerase
MRFTKMHGAGNDYVYVDGFQEQVADPAALARAVSDRHTGIGSDGLILILPSEVADARMRMFNPDGTESEMCGNGIRCVAKYVHDHGIARKPALRIETGAGVLRLEVFTGADGLVDRVRVDMGEPRLGPEEIPVDPGAGRVDTDGPVVRATVGVEGHSYELVCVGMGNPHAVVFVDDVSAVDLARLGPVIEHDVLFPRRTNVHFVQVRSAREVAMRTWERGTGATLACGTGACAVCVAGHLTGRTDRKILAHLPGGDLALEWAADNRLFMTGPAVEVFSGDWPGG